MSYFKFVVIELQRKIVCRIKCSATEVLGFDGTVKFQISNESGNYNSCQRLNIHEITRIWTYFTDKIITLDHLMIFTLKTKGGKI